MTEIGYKVEINRPVWTTELPEGYKLFTPVVGDSMYGYLCKRKGPGHGWGRVVQNWPFTPESLAEYEWATIDNKDVNKFFTFTKEELKEIIDNLDPFSVHSGRLADRLNKMLMED
jgi:hypothetical protein